MAIPDTNDTQTPPSPALPASLPPRPSWETVTRPVAAPRPGPLPAAPRPPEPPAASPYYAAPPASAAPEPMTFAPQPAAFIPQPDANIRYDLAGNPVGSATPAPAAPPQFGYSAGTPTAATAVWPPPVGGAPHFGAQAYRNNSGEQSHLPPEIERLRWHWGGFFFPILWTKNHGLTTIAAMLTGGLILLRVIRYIAATIDPMLFWGICGLYGLAFFGMQLYCGINGHKIGWRNRHFPGGVEEYFKVQRAWMWWGFGVNVFAGPILAFLLIAAIVGTTLATPHHRYHSSSNGDGTSSYNSYGSGSSNNGSGSSSAGQ